MSIEPLKLDALVNGQLLQLRFHDSAPFFSTPLGYAAADRVPLCISAQFPEVSPSATSAQKSWPNRVPGWEIGGVARGLRAV
jgi:hypothetical protein